MEDFQRKSQIIYKDDYVQEIENRTQKKFKEGIIAKEYQTLEDQDINSLTKKIAYGKQRVINGMKIWGSLFIILANSSLIYPLTVKLVRKLGIRGYINIHFAVFPLIINWNAITLGILNGCYNSYIFNQQLRSDKMD